MRKKRDNCGSLDIVTNLDVYLYHYGIVINRAECLKVSRMQFILISEKVFFVNQARRGGLRSVNTVLHVQSHKIMEPLIPPFSKLTVILEGPVVVSNARSYIHTHTHDNLKWAPSLPCIYSRTYLQKR